MNNNKQKIPKIVKKSLLTKGALRIQKTIAQKFNDHFINQVKVPNLT